MGWGAGKSPSTTGGRDVFFEFTKVGGQMRVAAIDSTSGIEVVIIAPLAATQVQMQTLALAKLKRRLEQGS